MRPRPSRSLAPAALALAGAALLAGCGAKQPEPAHPAAGQVSLAKLRCSDWEQADGALRARIVLQLTDIARGRIAGQPGPTLEPAAATGLFQRACANRFAASFVLYDIYNRAAAFDSIPAAG